MHKIYFIKFQKLALLGLITFFAFTPTYIVAQLGPGGVSVESAIYNGGTCNPDTGSTCGMWLDASTLTSLSDGDNVNLWPDVSTSYDCDDATVPSGFLAPIFRNDPAYTINGLPTITFEDNTHFILESSDDLNLNDVTYDKNLFMAFRTSEDISTEQMLYEEGGTVRGFNVMIQDNLVIIGAYDTNSDNDDGANGSAGDTPLWGYSYISKIIQPNTTYILSAKFKATAPGVANNNAYYYMQGWLNGISFGGPGQLTGGFNGSNYTDEGKLGTLFEHPNPCGLGAVNDDTVTRNEIIDTESGVFPFKGKLAEICYYKDELNETQRIIIENYFSAKYVATLENNNYYDYDYTYGKDLIGIGRKVNPQIHNLSQGRNPFMISASNNLSTAPNQFYMTGHNGSDLVWTNVGVPNNSVNTERLSRVWRVDRSSFTYGIHMKIDADKLPTRPIGYTSTNSKLVLLVDGTSSNIPDFTKPSTVVKELDVSAVSTFEYETTYDFPQGSFYTFAWLKPEINFTLTQEIAIESTPGSDYNLKFVEVKLNYEPINNGDAIDDSFTVDYTLIAGSANLGPGPGGVDEYGDDFYYNSDSPGLTSGQIIFAEGTFSNIIQFRVINDAVPEDPSTEEFSINITGTMSSGNAPDLLIGSNSTLHYTIYDDDPPPKISFASYATPIQYTEGDVAGSVFVDIIRNGTAGVVTCKVQVVNAGTTMRNSDLGLDPTDYDNSFITETITFPAGGPVTQTVEIPIVDDLVDEYTETLQLRIHSLVGGVAALSTAAIYQTIQVSDNDIPVASFASLGQSGYESIGAPSLLITLDPISSRDVVVDYTMTPGTATYNQDYTGFVTGTVVFPPFTNEGFVGPFNVSPDNITEPAETVLFELTGTSPDGDPTIVQSSNSTYTIFDYEPFEWQGVAGVGKSRDNIVWLDASQEPLGTLNSISNRSPQSISITKNGQAAENVSNAINGMNAFQFNGSATTANASAYEIENSTKINTAGTVDRMSYYFVMSPDNVPTSSAHPNNANTSHARILYEQGGTSRGTSIYIYNSKLYFHAWNNPDDDGAYDGTNGDQAPWGHTNSGSSGTSGWINSLYAVSAQNLVVGTNYIISCHYDNSNETEPLMVYVNGVKGSMSNLNAGSNSYGVGRLWGHSGAIGLGADLNFTLLHFTRDDLSNRECPFSGKMAEFILFHEPEMTESRRVIIENYFSAKYSISLDDSDTPQVWPLGDLNQEQFKNGIASVGQEHGGTSEHLDSKGPNTILRINNPSFDGNNEGYLIWGHNGEALVNTWPYSSAASNVLPEGINERSGQVWKFFKRGTVNTANIQIDFSASNNSNILNSETGEDLLKLLVHSNPDPQDFSTALVYDLTTLPGGNVAQFNNVPITDGMYITLANTSDYFTTPLPIELLSFNAKLNGNKVDLDWITSTEVNNDYFEIERADDNFKWESLLTTPGAGNSTSENHYAKVDFTPLNGISYYRLKQVDFDGNYTYSDAVSVVNTQVETEEFFIFPNPTHENEISMFIPDFIDDYAMVTVFDLTGKIRIQKIIYEGQRIEKLALPELSTGLYLIQLKSNQFDGGVKKLIVE